MKKYRVIYVIEIEAENEDEVLDIIAEHKYDDFTFVDAEFEEIDN